jgi:MOSC domain-containing protein YiiM
MAEIYSIVYQPAPSEHVEPYRYNRVPLETATLIAEHGIEGDLKAGHHPERHLNIMSLETLEVLRVEGYQAGPGQMGEQLIVSGLDVYPLPAGTRLQLGEEAVVEITKQRSGCDWFEKIQGKTREVPLGVLAKVITGGAIRVGDGVKVLQLT